MERVVASDVNIAGRNLRMPSTPKGATRQAGKNVGNDTSKDARMEADRASIPLTLMTLDDLVEALLDHYENLDMETKQLVPLKRLYWPL